MPIDAKVTVKPESSFKSINNDQVKSKPETSKTLQKGRVQEEESVKSAPSIDQSETKHIKPSQNVNDQTKSKTMRIDEQEDKATFGPQSREESEKEVKREIKPITKAEPEPSEIKKAKDEKKVSENGQSSEEDTSKKETKKIVNNKVKKAEENKKVEKSDSVSPKSAENLKTVKNEKKVPENGESNDGELLRPEIETSNNNKVKKAEEEVIKSDSFLSKPAGNLKPENLKTVTDEKKVSENGQLSDKELSRPETESTIKENESVKQESSTKNEEQKKINHKTELVDQKHEESEVQIEEEDEDQAKNELNDLLTHSKESLLISEVNNENTNETISAQFETILNKVYLESCNLYEIFKFELSEYVNPAYLPMIFIYFSISLIYYVYFKFQQRQILTDKRELKENETKKKTTVQNNNNKRKLKK
jgi:hypothetical protein